MSRWLALHLLLGACAGPAGTDAGVPFDSAAPDAPVHVPRAFVPSPETRAYCTSDDAVEARITAILASLSLDQKVALLHGAGLVDGAWQAAQDDAHGIPGLHMLDGPRGLSTFSNKHGTSFPVGMMRGATFSPELEQRVGAAMARELRSAGADVLLAPTLNILRHPRWGRAQETYGEDVHHLGEMGAAFVTGVQSEGVLASVKHFALNSIENTRHTVDVQVDERSLREVYLPHFHRAIVDAHAASVMSAYNQVNGSYCDLNGHLLHDILEGEWGFAGFVESDWILGTHAGAASIEAGLDIEMPSALRFASLAGAVRGGQLAEDEIDDAARRVLRAQLCFGLDTRARVLDDPSARETPEHLALAFEVAQRGLVLLRNEPPSAPILPLSAASLTHVAVLGRTTDVENIGDVGSSRVTPSAVVTELEGLRDRLDPAITIDVVPSDPIDAAGLTLIAGADAVIVFTGLLASDEGEGEIGAGDRASLALPASEVARIHAAAAASDHVIVVLEGGAAITVSDWVDEVEALIFAFYPGEQGGAAIADLILGRSDPSGRLPFSIPVAEADLPLFDDVSTTVSYGYFFGYRYLEHEGIAPAYPFGFGLSYTTFTLANLTSASSIAPDATLEVGVDVTNTGTRAGIETVQAYVSVMSSSVERAPQDLRAFAQVTLGPGEMQTVTLEVPAAALGYYDVTSSAWVVEATDYELRVGTSSADLPLRQTFRVE